MQEQWARELERITVDVERKKAESQVWSAVCVFVGKFLQPTDNAAICHGITRLQNKECTAEM